MATLMMLSSCATESPPEQTNRLRKAAGVSAFRIVCTQDLWDRTGGEQGKGFGSTPGIPAKVTRRSDGLVTVELTGPNLVDLLKYLDKKAHPGGPERSDALAVRMYDAIAPRIDASQRTPRTGDPVPEVIIDDTVRTTSGTPTPSTSR